MNDSEENGEEGRGAPTPLDVRGLHNRLNRISHWDVNVRDLERSRSWYEATTTLRVVAETMADQSFPGLGLSRGRFNGYMMRDMHQGGKFPMIHLVQWQAPEPIGEPYSSHANVGWYRIVPSVVELEATRQIAIDLGSTPFSPTVLRYQKFHANVPAHRYNVFTVHDPDGIAVEFSYSQLRKPCTPEVVAHNTTNVERYLPFYVDTLGLDFIQGLQVPGPMPNVYSPGGGLTQHDGALLGLRGDTRVMFDWLQWDTSPTLPNPYREPNHIGIIRCAIEVDDLAASCQTLRRSTWAEDGQIAVSMPEDWDLGQDFGTMTVVNFTDPEGVAFQLVQQPPFPHANIDSYGTRRTYMAT